MLKCTYAFIFITLEHTRIRASYVTYFAPTFFQILGHRVVVQSGLAINVRLPMPETHYTLLVVMPPARGKKTPVKKHISIPVDIVHDKLNVTCLDEVKAKLKFHVRVQSQCGHDTIYTFTPYKSQTVSPPENMDAATVSQGDSPQ